MRKPAPQKADRTQRSVSESLHRILSEIHFDRNTADRRSTEMEKPMSEFDSERDCRQMLPISGTAKLASIESDFRTSAELLSISNRGVTVRLTEQGEPPMRFAILIPDHRINVGCRVVWRHRDKLGLIFDRMINVPDCLPRAGDISNRKATEQFQSEL